jgi:urea transport system ATP-binding protein
VFESHTVEDNLELALAGGRGPFQALFSTLTPEAKSRIDELLTIIRLTDRRYVQAKNLSHGQKQWLEIGMLLAQEPKLLLVDEPAAGMTDAETEATAELLKEIAKEKSVIVVEHDMAFVRALGVKVTVLHEGSVLSEGTIDHVSADPRVIEVYLGR